MPKGRGNGKGAPGKRTVAPRPMNKPAMMDWVLRLLRTLDAMHLVITREIDASVLATADRIMAAGAHEMGFSVVRFFRFI